jgi:hypothetical protein
MPSFDNHSKVLSETTDIRGVTYCRYSYCGLDNTGDTFDTAVRDASNRVCAAIDAVLKVPETLMKCTKGEVYRKRNVKELKENISTIESTTEILNTSLDMPKVMPKSSKKGDIFPEVIFVRRDKK